MVSLYFQGITMVSLYFQVAKMEHHCMSIQQEQKVQLTSSSQMYPMASREASFTASVLEVPDTLRRRLQMISGHWPAGSSAAAM